MSGSEYTFERVWQMFQETDRQFKETDKKFQETAEQFKETDKKFQETAEQFKETDKKFQETDRQFRETDKKVRSLETLFTSQWGRLVEALVEGELVKLLKERGISVEQTYERQKKKYKGRDFEFDIIAKNGTDVVPVEVKTTLRSEDVKDFLENLKLIKEVFPDYRNNNIYGAVAFLRCESKSDVFAMKEGLFVIRAVGDSASIL
ncbi:MAG TPA: hypothetical protein PL163_23635, partial [Leptospiraceae bacterium]|nr:hypothetical protein [Leptospiraceae bacterium]